MFDAAGLLYLLRDNPTLMPRAPDDRSAWAQAIEHRRLDEVHACLQCGGRADVAYIAEVPTDIPGVLPEPRWLDLCRRCAHWLQSTLPPDLEPRDPREYER
jgi:hypothetical protein